MPAELHDLSARVLAGRYRFDRPLAAGGMAQVWEATDLVLARRVAIKVLRPDLAADPGFARRFRREARAAARLNHPGIVAIFDTSSEDDLEAIVMEFVPGETLRQRLDRGALSPHEAVGIGAQVADALEAAHRAGLVHRDIKPANILLCPEPVSRGGGTADIPRVVVTDFGIAKAVAGLATDRNDTGRGLDETDLTTAGTLLGTAKYLAPEQVTGGSVDGRTDLYALGVVLYEALCGRAPFTADTDLGTALARMHQPPLLPRQIRADLRRDLEAVVMRCLEVDPERRFPSASELRAALLAADPGPSDQTLEADLPTVEPGDVPTFVESERHWLLPAVAVLAIAVALTAAGVAFGRTTAGRAFVDRALEAVGAREGEQATTTTSAAPGRLATNLRATSFDPTDGEEREELAKDAVDGDPSTEWRTKCYLGDLNKAGVGLVVQLDGEAALDTLELDTPRTGWRGEIYVADGAASALDGWGTPVAQVNGSTTTTSVALGGRRGAAVLVWITSVANIPADNCFASLENSHRFELSEVRVRIR